MERDDPGGSDVGRDLERDLGDEPPAARSATPRPTTSRRSTQSRRSAATRPRPDRRRRSADAPEHDWSAAQGAHLPGLPPGRDAGPRRWTRSTATSLVSHGAQSHAQPLLDRARPGCPVVYTIDAGGFDIVVNGDHLLSWGVEPAEVQDAAMGNLAAWSATAPWTDEVSGERRLVSSDTGDGWDAARILLPEVIDAPGRRARRRRPGPRRPPRAASARRPARCARTTTSSPACSPSSSSSSPAARTSRSTGGCSSSSTGAWSSSMRASPTA